MKTLPPIQGHLITVDDQEVIRWTSKGDIDGDGIGPSFGDPCYQRDTSLHYQGKPLNSKTQRYIAVPPEVERGVEGIVLGSQCYLRYSDSGWISGVVGDTGPENKLGEMSEAYAVALGIQWSPISGGVPSGVEYEVQAGIAAIVDDQNFELQPL